LKKWASQIFQANSIVSDRIYDGLETLILSSSIRCSASIYVCRAGKKSENQESWKTSCVLAEE
jgi:hypothetical protein